MSRCVVEIIFVNENKNKEKTITTTKIKETLLYAIHNAIKTAYTASTAMSVQFK